VKTKLKVECRKRQYKKETHSLILTSMPPEQNCCSLKSQQEPGGRYRSSPEAGNYAKVVPFSDNTFHSSKVVFSMDRNDIENAGDASATVGHPSRYTKNYCGAHGDRSEEAAGGLFPGDSPHTDCECKRQELGSDEKASGEVDCTEPTFVNRPSIWKEKRRSGYQKSSRRASCISASGQNPRRRYRREQQGGQTGLIPRKKIPPQPRERKHDPD